jgi:hypothetical protein
MSGDRENPTMRSNWRVSKVVNGSIASVSQPTDSSGTTITVNSGGGASTSATYSVSNNGTAVTVTVNPATRYTSQFGGGGFAHQSAACLVRGIADAFVMAPATKSDVASTWARDFESIAADFNKVIVRAHERTGKHK